MLPDVTDWERAEESSGTKRGYWVFEPGTRRRGLVKVPRFRQQGQFFEGEAWSEVLASRVAKLLSLPVPDVDAVRFEGVVCPISWNCCPRGWELREGVALAGSSEEKKGLSFDQILQLLQHHLDKTEARDGLIRLACLDILTGNTDRHWQNWGVMIPPPDLEDERPRMAPYYDNGSAFASNFAPARMAGYVGGGRA